MCVKLLILFIGAIQFLFSQTPEHPLIEKSYIEPGRIDAFVLDSNIDEPTFLVQLDLINDSLLTLMRAHFPDGNFTTGPGSFQRLMNHHHLAQLSAVLSDDIYHFTPYNAHLERRLFWYEVKHGSNTYGTWTDDDAIAYDCSCLNGASDCVRLGWYEWYNPFDYWGEAWYAFDPPFYQTIDEIRVTVRGAQCDDLPLSSESYMGMRNDSGSWSHSYTLSIDYTDNTFVVPMDIWNNGMLMPQIGSEDNYVIDHIRLEFFYTCDPPESGPSNIFASDAESCTMVDINWELSPDESTGQRIYRDGELIATLPTDVSQYQDWLANPGREYVYCVENYNECGNSWQACNPGRLISIPEPVANVTATDGTLEGEVLVNWEDSDDADSYKIYREGLWLGLGSPGQTSYSDTFVDLDVNYEYCLEALNLCGGSEWSCDVGFSSELPGDVNADGLVNVLDVVIIVNVILLEEIITEYISWSADLNYDGNINIMDIILLINRILV